MTFSLFFYFKNLEIGKNIFKEKEVFKNKNQKILIGVLLMFLIFLIIFSEYFIKNTFKYVSFLRIMVFVG